MTQWSDQAVATLLEITAGALAQAAERRKGQVTTAGATTARPFTHRRPARRMPPAQATVVRDTNGSGSGPLSPMVAHELRTPLATALMYMRIAERRIDAGDDETLVRSALAVACDEILRVERLVVRVTELEELGHPVLSPRLIDLGRVVSEMVRRTRAIGGDRAAHLELDMAPRKLLGWWDDDAIEQIIQNLLSNALKFGAGRPIRVVLEPGTSGVQLVVRDRGVGIPANDRERIFERNVHAPADKAGGLGLGLWLVRSLAEAHGGSVSVNSRPGHGATFRVLLRPLAPSRQLPSPPVEPRLSA